MSPAPFVFLHGLTFDRHMWDPVMDALPRGRRALALDLPGHGGSPALADHDPEHVIEVIHAAVLAAGIEAPVMVGHSMGAMVATAYAAEHPVAGVVNVDAPMRSEPFARLVQSLEPQLRGDGFQRVWSMFRASMHAERLPAAMRELLRAGDDASQELVLSYWKPLLEHSPEEAQGWTEALLNCLRAAGVPYLAIFSEERGPAESAWLAAQLPDAEIAIWAVVHHFPHLADPARFAALLTAFAAQRAELARR